MPGSTLDTRNEYRRVLRLMGNRFEITLVHNDYFRAEYLIDRAVEEIQRIERLLTTFSEDSQTAEINRFAGIRPVKVDKEVFSLIWRSLKISDLTQGAFDISYGSVDKKLWNFDANMTELPDPRQARESVRLINYRNIVLSPVHQTVYLREKGMRIGFGGIGKGYAAGRARELLRGLGVMGGIINAAGDLATWGTNGSGAPWTVGIADPLQKHMPFSSFDITDVAVATSGNYEKYTIIDGKRYSHTIDPRTGLPVQGIKSVTIICPDAELADALTTPVMVMGIKPGLYMINQMRNIACVIIDDWNNIYTSKNISLT